MTIKFGNFANFIVRNFVVIWEAPIYPRIILRRRPFFERKHICNSQENGVRTRIATIVDHFAIGNLLRRVNLLRRSIFSTAGSFGQRKEAHIL